MRGYVYILRCSDDSFYTGSTHDLRKRIYEHKSGKGPNWTRRRLPVEVVFVAEFPAYFDALVFEKRVKGWTRRKKMALIAGDYALLPALAECKNETHFRNKDLDLSTI